MNHSVTMWGIHKVTIYTDEIHLPHKHLLYNLRLQYQLVQNHYSLTHPWEPGCSSPSTIFLLACWHSAIISSQHSPLPVSVIPSQLHPTSQNYRGNSSAGINLPTSFISRIATAKMAILPTIIYLFSMIHIRPLSSWFRIQNSGISQFNC